MSSIQSFQSSFTYILIAVNNISGGIVHVALMAVCFGREELCIDILVNVHSGFIFKYFSVQM